MGYQLIITEKPNAAKKIAEALADGKPIRNKIGTVAYYEVTHGNQDLVIASAVGHLFTVVEKDKGKWTYPVFNVKWEQSSKANKASAFTSKYVTALKKLSKDADSFVVATDFDIEGEVIGYNVLKHICKQKDADRMKFSTLTKEELRKSYAERKNTLEWGQVNAGVTRHELDWFYGINLSRALTLAIKQAGMFKLMSSGRVQGPALKIVVEREKDIAAFVPEPYWQIQLLGDVKKSAIEAWHVEDKIFDKKRAEEIITKTKGKNGVVSDVSKKQFKQQPPTPFDLTSLQIECYRVHRIQPKETLEIAQELYTAGIISYPRTSSQQLPPIIGYKKILTALEKNELFATLARKVLKFKELKPNNGKKTDAAHPAVYPTGLKANLDDRPLKVYDLIVKRFFATFGVPAVRETVKITVDVDSEKFVAKGTRTIEKNWHELYIPYVKLEEQEMPALNVKDLVDVKEINKLDKETQPPKRYTPASIIKELEKKNLGTKATRASVIDTLFKRRYVSGQPIEATKLGLKTIETLDKYCPQILDEELTKHFEEEMEQIYERKKEGKTVLKEAQVVLTKILATFKKNEASIGESLIESHKDSETKANTIGPCQQCSGTLMIKRGKFGYFIACTGYPDCTATFKLPGTGMTKPTKDLCQECNHPIIKVIKRRKRPEDVCINPECISKGFTPEMIAALEKEGMTCEKCKRPMRLRRSLYGAFWGCTGWPDCRGLKRIKKEEDTSIKE